MTSFTYKASDVKGNVVEGSMEAKEKGSVAVRLQEQGYIPIRITPSETEGVSKETPLSALFNRISQEEMIVFTQELSGLLKAGVPFDRSMKTLIGLVENHKFKEVLKNVLKGVEEGGSLADSMAHFPKVFPVFYVSLIRAGEVSGALDKTLSRLSEFLARARELRNHITSALVYPVVLTMLGGLSVIILLTFVIPRFATTFSDMGQAIPLPTIILLRISDIANSYWWVFSLAVAAIYALWYSYTTTSAGRMSWDRFKLSIPLVSDIIRKAEVVRFSRTLGTLLNGGVSLIKSLDIVEGAMENRLIASSLILIKDKVRRGEGLGKPLKHEGIFPPMAVEMISVGEETGRLDGMLLEVAENFDQQVKESAKRFLALLEPALIVIMGLVVGSIVICMLLAIFSVNEIPF